MQEKLKYTYNIFENNCNTGLRINRKFNETI